MSIEGRRQIESILIREEYPKGVIALNEGEVAHELVFVGKGMLRQYYYKNGKDVTEHFSYEGCILMCIESLLKQVPTRLIIETLEPAVIYLFPYDKMMQLTKQNWEINMFYGRYLNIPSLYRKPKPIPGVSNPPASVIIYCSKLIRKSSTGTFGTHRFLPADDTGNIEPSTFRRSVVF